MLINSISLNRVSQLAYPLLSLSHHLYQLILSLASRIKIGKKLSIVMLHLVIMMIFLLPSRNHAMVSQSPSPSPQPDPSNFSPTNGVTPGSLHPQECGSRCTYRCSKTAFKKPCMFFCQKCCAKCLCVPAGTYGNKQTCPCYNNWKTKRGGPKCP